MKILKVENVNKKYKEKTVLDKLSFSVEKEKIVGLVGQNGAGKTTIFRIILGLSYPDSGNIEVFGKCDGYRNKIGSLIELPGLYLDMSAKDNMEVVQILKGSEPGEIKQLLDEIGLSYKDKKQVKDFSLGMKQRLGIAMSLVGKPQMLILDEPINGLDPIGINEINKLLLRLNKDRKITIIISSHILSELESIASEFLIMDKGKIIDTILKNDIQQKNCSLDDYFLKSVLGKDKI